ncbi:MAG: site-specific integrase, partial [Myxococcota bacterium]
MGVYRRKDTGKWMIDVAIVMPDGSEKRVRRSSPVQTKRGAETYERDVRVSLAAGTFEKQKAIPTLSEFKEEFIGNYARSNNKPSEVASKKVHLENHLIPRLGKKRLDQIGVREIEAFKAHQLSKAKLNPKTVNNQLTTLRKLLNTAEEWGLIEQVPRVKPLKTPPSDFDFLSFEEAPRLIEAAKPGLWRTMVTVALDTGLRIGELRALHWEDVDLRAKRLRIHRSMWKLELGSTKSNRAREIPLNQRSLAALKAHRHLRGELVFCGEDGSPLTEKAVQHGLRQACKIA